MDYWAPVNSFSMQMRATQPNKELQGIFQRSRQRILSIMDDALLFTEIDVHGDRPEPAPVSLSKLLSRAVAGADDFAASRNVAFDVPSGELGTIIGDEDLFVRAFRALLETAVKFSGRGETVRLSHDALPESSRVLIESHGMRIPDSALDRFFDLFSISITPGGDLGVGPALAFRIFALFGASVVVANREPSGIGLTVSLSHPPKLAI
jgi:signal transduction histidine kinase